MRISQENENCQGQTNRQPQEKSGKKKTYHRVGLSFPKFLRILAKGHFRKVQQEGSRISGVALYFQCYCATPPTRLGITVSKKYGKAHDRNYLKRLIREVFRECYDEIPKGLQINVSPRLPRIQIDKASVLQDFRFLIDSFARELS